MTGSLPAAVATALRPPGVRERLRPFGDHVTYRPAVTSTSDLCMELARDGAPDGTVVLASEQTGGRGRLGRQWFSPAQRGLYLSLLLRDTAVPMLSLLTGVAVVEGVRAATGLDVALKWPNDIVSRVTPPRRGVGRKLAGILCESVTPRPRASALSAGVVVGIGINVATGEYPPEIVERALSLEECLGHPVDSGVVLVETLAGMARWRRRWVTDGPEPVLARWRDLSPSSHGSPVRWDTARGTRSGVTAGIGPDGALLVSTEDRIERVVGGTLEWLAQ